MSGQNDNTGITVKNKTEAVGAEVKAVRRDNVIRRVKGQIDMPLLVLTVLLTGIGLVMVFSASYPWAENDYGNSYHYVLSQLEFAALGFAGMVVAACMDFRKRMNILCPAAYGVGLVLLALVMVIGVEVNGAKRWIELGGIRLQPTEPMKLAMIMMLAWYISKYVDTYRDLDERTINFKKGKLFHRSFSDWCAVVFRECLIPMAIIGATCLLTIFEKHLSGTVIIAAIGIVVMFWGRIQKTAIAAFIGLGAAGGFAYIQIKDYSSDRISAWLDPYKYELTSGWQIIQGLNAIGSGGLFGVGYTNSTLKHMYLPEPQNDYIFAIVCEEFGFVGATVLLIIFALFIWRGFVITMRAPDCFSRLLAAGIVCKIALQVVLNVGVVTSLIPPTGISMPFISYGGTALVLLLVECGILLSISRFSTENKI